MRNLLVQEGINDDGIKKFIGSCFYRAHLPVLSDREGNGLVAGGIARKRFGTTGLMDRAYKLIFAAYCGNTVISLALNKIFQHIWPWIVID